MSIIKNTNLGSINISNDAIATLAGGVVTECYGVVGMASQKVFKDGIAVLLKKDNYSKGVVVRSNGNGLEIDLYIIISFGVKVTEVISEVQKKVKYVLEKTLGLEVAACNVFVQDVRVVE